MKRQLEQRIALAALVAAALIGLSCKTSAPNLSVSLTESPGAPPTSLTERVTDIHSSQTLAHENLLATHELFQQLTAPQAPDLGKLSRELERNLKTCNRDAGLLSRHIDAFEEESNQLFADWKTQLEQLGDAERAESKDALERTEDHARRVLEALRSVQKKM